MTKVSVITKNTALRRLRKTFVLALAAGTVFGLYNSIPRIENELDFKTNRTKLVGLANAQQYDQVYIQLGNIKRIGLLKAGEYESLEDSVLKVLRLSTERKIDEFLALMNYNVARDVLVRANEYSLFTGEERDSLEVRIEQTHPDTLERKGDRNPVFSERINFYKTAEILRRNQGEDISRLRNKTATAYLEDLSLAFLQSDSSKTDLKPFIEYLREDSSFSYTVDISKVNDFENKFEEFLGREISGPNPRLGYIKWFSQFHELVKFLPVPVSRATDAYIRSVDRRISSNTACTNTDLFILEDLIKTSLTLGLGRENEIGNLLLIGYRKLHADVSQARRIEYLEELSLYSNLVSGNVRRDLNAELKTAYVKFAEESQDSDVSYRFLQKARLHYFEANFGNASNQSNELREFAISELTNGTIQRTVPRQFEDTR